MHLVEVDVIGLQPLETGLHFAHDVHPRGAAPIEIVAHGEPDLGSQDDLRPHAFQGITDQSFALPEAVHVRRVNEVDALIQG